MTMRQKKHHTIARMYVGDWNTCNEFYRRPSAFFHPYPVRSFWK